MATNWIAGITVGKDGRLRPLVQGGPIPRTPALADLAPELGLPGGLRRKASFPLHELRPGSTSEYLEGLDLGHLCADGQPTYEASCSLGTLVIPAQLLVMTTLGMNHQLRHNLLSVHAPGFLGTAIAGPDYLDVVPTPHRMDKLPIEAPQVLNRLEWLLTYPSAQAAWGSVYRRALAGQFDMSMPKAHVETAVSGHFVNGKFLVTKLMVMKLLPREAPAEFAEHLAKSEFVFNDMLHRRPTHGKAAAPSREERVASARGPGPLTDEEWLRVEPLLTATANPRYPGAPRRHTMRETVNVILLKVGTPYSWLKMPVERELVQSANVLLSKLKRRGVWEQIVAALA
jgi:hypothetical protein